MHHGFLYPSEFLQNGITAYAEWKNLDDSELDAFEAQLREVVAPFLQRNAPNEAATEEDLIEPILKALGWENHWQSQPSMTSKDGGLTPDYLLFLDQEHKNAAAQAQNRDQRFLHGCALLEAKAWDIHLDRQSPSNNDRGPDKQIINYVRRAYDNFSNSNIRFGILTNGRRWRLYYARARSMSEEYLELDLLHVLRLEEPPAEDMAAMEPRHLLRIFYLMFRPQAFQTDHNGHTFQERARHESERWEAMVAENLRQTVFEEVFPQVLKAIIKADPHKPEPLTEEYLLDVRQNAFYFLYRLLFILYAEDRDLLPVRDPKYRGYGIQIPLRKVIMDHMDMNDIFSDARDKYYHHLTGLFNSIDKGDSAIGLPSYNGGLFKPENTPILERIQIPDADLAPIIDQLSRREENGNRVWINYRDLSVQQLGSVYEGLLEFFPRIDESGELYLRPNIFARKTSGSYYTPEELVKLTIASTLEPLLKEQKEAFYAQAEHVAERPTENDRQVLEGLDPATAALKLKILDPAMGSGHFLVTLVDYLTDQVLGMIDETTKVIPDYSSPLLGEIESLRSHIQEQAREHGWAVSQEQLDDRQLVRRMILKRCVYGVDKNPMAVELAKVSLWLHTFTVGAPLSFLDHHLRWGDSLFGEWVHRFRKDLGKDGGLFLVDIIEQTMPSKEAMREIEQRADADIREVEESAQYYQQLRAYTDKLDALMKLNHAFKWLVDKKDKARKKLINDFYQGNFGDIPSLALGQAEPASPGNGVKPEEVEAFAELLHEARTLIDEEGFLNWQVTFPTIWHEWETARKGGFDAVVGNPPWERMKLQQVEWFAQRDPEIARQGRAADRNKLIQKLEKSNPELHQEFIQAEKRAKTATSLARNDGDYPTLARGDINLYSLMIERAHTLAHPRGMVGLVTPSGIASDLNAAPFFKEVATSGRLAHFYDFENKKVFFPDVDSRFKFCVFVAGASARKTEDAQMAFFLHNLGELEEEGRRFHLSAEDFALVNPNTGTSPILRSQRDADILKHVYQKFPVLHNRAKDEMVWPMKYHRMFDMTNDSHLFKRREEVEAEGFYPVGKGHWKKGGELYVPLYEGKMVQMYNHRAAKVVVNPDNLKRPAQQVKSSLEDLKNPNFFAESQSYVLFDNLTTKQEYFIGFKNVTAPTNVRTLINAILPLSGVGNSLPILLCEEENYSTITAFIQANFSSFMFDYLARQKVHGQNLNWFIIEQLPVIPPETYEQPLNANWGSTRVGDFVKEHVLRLSYTAWDLEPFARDLGYTGEPFPFDEEDRRHRMAKLDALYFLLYGLSEDDADYVLSTFPIVEEHDRKQFGSFRTSELIQHYMRVLQAGDLEVIVEA